MNHLPNGILLLALGLLTALLNASNGVNPFSIGRARLADEAVFKPLPNGQEQALETVSKQCVSFMNALMTNGKRAVQSAHKRHPLLAQKNYTHMFFVLETLKTLIASKQVGAAYYVANKAAIYQLDAHFPAINAHINRDLDDKTEAVIPAFPEEAMKKLSKAQHKFARALPLLESKMPDQSTWVGNFFEVAMALGDILVASESIPSLDSEMIYKLSHAPRYLEHMASRSDEFMKRGFVDRFTLFKKSVDEIDNFLAGKAVESPETAEFLRRDRATRALYNPLIKNLGSSKSSQGSASASASASIDEIMKMFKLEEAPKKKPAGRLPINKLPIVEVDTFKKDAWDKTPSDSDDDSDGDSHLSEAVVPQVVVPAVAARPKHDYHDRDIRYSLLVIGEYIYNRYLAPFTEAYNWNAMAEPIWTDIVDDIDDPDCDEIHDSLAEIGVDKDFFKEAVVFYLTRVDQAHPIGIAGKMNAAHFMAAYRQNENLIPERYRPGLQSLMQMLRVNGERLDMDQHPRTPNLLAPTRPKDLESPWIVNRALDTADLYQALYELTIIPILNRLRIRNPEHLNPYVMQDLEDEEGYIGWPQVEALLYGLRPDRNTLCHPNINLRRVRAYLDVWRDHPQWDPFFSVIRKKVQAEIDELKVIPMKRRFGGRN